MRPDTAASLILAALLIVSPFAAWAWLHDSSQDRAIMELIERHGSPERVTGLDANGCRRVVYLEPGGRVKTFLVLSNGRVVESIR